MIVNVNNVEECEKILKAKGWRVVAYAWGMYNTFTIMAEKNGRKIKVSNTDLV